MNYVVWALLGMVGYSFTTLFVKLATQNGQVPAFLVLAVATAMAAAVATTVCLIRGDHYALAWRTFASTHGLWTIATGIALSVAVTSLFRALSLGPASVVVPIYGMFIVGGALLGILVLGEELTVRKSIGIVLATASIFLIAGNKQ